MRRDWIGEIRQYLDMEEISRVTGISQKRLREFYTGKRKLHSKMPEYEKIRNLNRRLAYDIMRESGATPKQAHVHRRTFFDPFATEKESIITKYVKPENLPPDEVKYQVRILGVFRHRKTKEERIEEGFSWAYSQMNIAVQLEEAINSARGRLGSTHWEIKKLLEQEWIIYKSKEE